MAIPYSIKSLLPGRFQIKSEFFKHIPVSEDAVRHFISQKKGVSKVKISKKTGNLTLEYEPKTFDPGEFFNILDTATPQFIAMALSQAENAVNGIKTKEKGNGEGSANKWLVLNTIAFVPFLFRSSIPFGFFTALTLGLAVPIFKKALNSIKNRKIDVHLLDSSAIALSTFLRNPFSSMLMIWLLSLGDLIEEKTQGTAHREIEKLLNYRGEAAWLVSEDGNTVKVSVAGFRGRYKERR